MEKLLYETPKDLQNIIYSYYYELVYYETKTRLLDQVKKIINYYRMILSVSDFDNIDDLFNHLVLGRYVNVADLDDWSYIFNM